MYTTSRYTAIEEGVQSQTRASTGKDFRHLQPWGHLVPWALDAFSLVIFLCVVDLSP